MSVAEAMLGGCIPVINKAGALPEVTGECGVVVDSVEPTAIAKGVARALALPEGHRLACRERVLNQFPLEERGRNLEQVVLALTNAGNNPLGVRTQDV
jgi:glycosyltransferase involved in cell wall biosynthesis